MTAFRAALEERTRERVVPLQWAMTQNNLGNALSTLGGRESGTECLEQAVVAYRAALEEFAAEGMSWHRDRAQNNLNNVLQRLPERGAEPSSAADPD